jgi:hypothetical protein
MYRCLGCGRLFGHKTGLNNHRRVCDKWDKLDRVEKHKKKRLEMLEMQNMGPDPGPAQPNDLLTKVSNFCL